MATSPLETDQALVLYTHPMSRGRIVRWMLEETGQPYRAEVLGYGRSMKSAEYLAINPMGKVPALAHRGVVVTETAAICAYLADAFASAGLAPALDDPRRGAYLRLLFLAAGPLEAAITNRALGVEVAPEKAVFVGYGGYDTVLGVVEQAVAAADPWLLGHAFSAADVYLGSQILFGLKFKTISPTPVLAAYAQRLMARPAWQRAGAADDALAQEHAGQ